MVFIKETQYFQRIHVLTVPNVFVQLPTKILIPIELEQNSRVLISDKNFKSTCKLKQNSVLNYSLAGNSFTL